MFTQESLQVAREEAAAEYARDQQDTLESNVPSVEFLGIGDRHDYRYDSMDETYDIGSGSESCQSKNGSAELTNMISQENFPLAREVDDENVRDQQDTLEINATFVEFLGIGDRHDSGYESMDETFDVGSISESSRSKKGGAELTNMISEGNLQVAREEDDFVPVSRRTPEEEEQQTFENGKNKKLDKDKKDKKKKVKEDKFEKNKNKKLDQLKAAIKKAEKELDETGRNQDSRISELDAEAEAAEKELQAVRDEIAAKEAKIAATLFSDKDRKKLNGSLEIIAYLRKENKRLRSSTTHLLKDIDATQENNRRLLEANLIAEASSEVLNGKYKINDSNNSQLMQSLDKYKKQNQELQGQMRMRQGFVHAEGKMRVVCQKTISVIVEMIQDQCDDADLTEDILSIALECEEDAKSELAAAKAAL
jgi:hypothetical protein